MSSAKRVSGGNLHRGFESLLSVTALPDVLITEFTDPGCPWAYSAEPFRRISHEHGMPIDTRERPRMAATLPACRAIVAARRHAPDRMRLLLRRLRVRHFSGELLDEPATTDAAATDAGIDPSELAR